jgi:hypothetical protein
MSVFSNFGARRRDPALPRHEIAEQLEATQATKIKLDVSTYSRTTRAVTARTLSEKHQVTQLHIRSTWPTNPTIEPFIPLELLVAAKQLPLEKLRLEGFTEYNQQIANLLLVDIVETCRTLKTFRIEHSMQSKELQRIVEALKTTQTLTKLFLDLLDVAPGELPLIGLKENKTLTKLHLENIKVDEIATLASVLPIHPTLQNLAIGFHPEIIPAEEVFLDGFLDSVSTAKRLKKFQMNFSDEHDITSRTVLKVANFIKKNQNITSFGFNNTHGYPLRSKTHVDLILDSFQQTGRIDRFSFKLLTSVARSVPKELTTPATFEQKLSLFAGRDLKYGENSVLSKVPRDLIGRITLLIRAPATASTKRLTNAVSLCEIKKQTRGLQKFYTQAT